MKNFFLLVLFTPLLFFTTLQVPSELVNRYTLLSATDPLALKVIDEVNTLRASKQLPPYSTNSILMTIAQSHTDYISGTGVTTHFSASGSRPYQRAIAAGYSVAGDLSQGGLFAENIGTGKGLTVEDVVSNWQDNSLDLETLLSPDLKDIGVGVKNVNGVSYYVLDVGVSISDPAISSPEVASTSTIINTTEIPGVPVVTSTSMDDGTVYHIVQANEALWNIALAYHTTIDVLKSLNGLPSNDIYEGQKLLIERPKKLTATPEVVITATFGIPTSTATGPVTPVDTATSTPLPVPPTTRRSGGMIVGIIVAAALVAAGLGSWLSGQKKSVEK